MAKKKTENAVRKAKRKLSKIQLRLEVAQVKHAQLQETGKQDIERARLIVAKRVAKSEQRLQRMADKLGRADARIAELRSDASDDAPAFVAEVPEEEQQEAPHLRAIL